MPDEKPPHPSLLVACLCADWCDLCRDYRTLFDALAREMGAEATFAWVDIEDDEAALGNVDVEDFPTLLIARGSDTLFFGPVMPHAQTLSRMVRSAASRELEPIDDARLAGLPDRVRAMNTDQDKQR